MRKTITFLPTFSLPITLWKSVFRFVSWKFLLLVVQSSISILCLSILGVNAQALEPQTKGSKIQNSNIFQVREVSKGIFKKVVGNQFPLRNPCDNKQKVKVEGTELLTDFDCNGEYNSFFVKGVGYAPYPVGTFPSEWGLCWYTGDVSGQPQFDCPGGVTEYDDVNVLLRDLPYLKKMNTNTIRSWGTISNVLMDILDQPAYQNIKVIAGFWIDHSLDYTDSVVGDDLKGQFVDYVKKFKDRKGLLMWGLSNENHLHFCSWDPGNEACRQEQAEAFYSLINDMVEDGHREEGVKYHPVMMVLADTLDEIENYGYLLPSLDIYGINSYRGKSFGSLFDDFAALGTGKPLLITEFGIDAWHTTNVNDPKQGYEEQAKQSEWDVSAWRDIVAHAAPSNGPAIGGVVFEYLDTWWLDHGEWSRTCATQEYGGWQGGGFPDGYDNLEWSGIMSVIPDGEDGNLDGLDTVDPREVYYELCDEFSGKTCERQFNYQYK